VRIESGASLLQYRVVEKIGEGGMGEVWRANDTTLGRDVAVKVLPAALATDPERLARFEREARLLASLNHPHVATLHGLHEVDGVRFLTMEMVEGEDLTDVIARGITVERAVEIATEIADALEAAHSAGVVHRDLKPANVRLTRSRTVKVLDFGLAKALGVGAVSGNEITGPSLSPTITSAGTVAGVILGTAAYMSPEQARGREVDRRTDLWAFGCLLYEMLTGQRAFEGETISDTIASVLKESPDLDRLPAGTPPSVRRLLRRCLAKDPRKRLADAGDAKIELREAFAAPVDGEGVAPAAATGPATPARSRRTWLPWAVAGAAVVVALAGWMRAGSGGADERAVLRLSIPVPEAVRLDDDQTANLAISRDGRRVVFTGVDENGRAALYLRELANDRVVKIAGTEDAENPFFSPDGAWIGFFVGTELRKIAVAGGNPIKLTSAIGAVRGATWTDDDRIVFTASFESGLSAVPGSGGEPTPVTTLDEARNERTHRWPHAVSGTDVVLFTVATKDSPEYYGDARIDAVRLGTGERKAIYEGASLAHYLPSGHLLVGRDGALWAMPFDLDRLEITGKPVPVVQEVMGARNSGAVYADVSETGILTYVAGAQEDPTSVLTWRRFDGTSEPLADAAPGGYGDIALSPDGKKVALSVLGDTSFDVWVHDIARAIPIRLTFEGDATQPVWTPDGKSIVFYAVRDGAGRAYRKAADGAGTESLVADWDGTSVQVEDVSPDGRTAVLSVFGATKGDLYLRDLDDPAAEPIPFVVGPGDTIQAQFSPDGRWIAYVSDESGEYQVMVRSASGEGGLWQVSRDSGILPRWSRDGRRLLFRIGRSLLAVDVDPDASAFRAGSPRVLLDDLDRSQLAKTYSVALDGEGILIGMSDDAGGPPDTISVVVNWLDALAREVPTGR